MTLAAEESEKKEAETNKNGAHVTTEYGADKIKVLEGLEAVRKATWYVHW